MSELSIWFLSSSQFAVQSNSTSSPYNTSSIFRKALEGSAHLDLGGRAERDEGTLGTSLLNSAEPLLCCCSSSERLRLCIWEAKEKGRALRACDANLEYLACSSKRNQGCRDKTGSYTSR